MEKTAEFYSVCHNADEKHFAPELRGWPEIPLILGRSGTPYVVMGIKLLGPNCRAHLVEFYCKE